MKKIILVFLVLFNFSTSFIFGGDFRVLPTTKATIINYARTIPVTFTNPHTNLVETRNIGYLLGRIEIDNPVPIYQSAAFLSLDIDGDISYTDSSYSALSPYYLMLSQLLEMNLQMSTASVTDSSGWTAAIQLALWHYMDNLDVNTITDENIRNWTIQMCETNSQYYPEHTMNIYPLSEPDQFYVRQYGWCRWRHWDNPYDTVYAYLSTTEGVLSHSTTITFDNFRFSNGYPVKIDTITFNGSNNAVITARSPHGLHPRGIVYTSPGKRRMFYISGSLGVFFPYEPLADIEYSVEWGVLPVQLTSFTSTVDINNVTLNWTTTSELNNSEFQVEREYKGVWKTIAYVPGNGTSTISHKYEYIDEDVQSGKYTYRLMQVDYNGNFDYHNLSNEVVIGIPNQYTLKQNYPNPFNPTTTIGYSFPLDSRVNLIVYDVTGKEIISLVTNEQKTAGYYATIFDARSLSSGIYYYRLIAGDYKETKKMMLIK